MRPGEIAPPRAAERLLAAALGARRFTSDLLGDLAERHAARARIAPRRALAAYWLATLPLLLRFGPGALAGAIAELVVPSRPRSPRKEPRMSQFLFDFRLSWRSLAKRPGASALVVLTLAVGLGANAAVFGILDALVLHPFRFEESDRLILVSEQTPNSDAYDTDNLSPATFLELREESRDLFEALVGFDRWDANLRGSEGPEKIQGYRTSPELLDALRLHPALGRFFSAAESAPGGERVVVLGYQLWQRQFGGDRSVLGRVLEIDGASHRVVGVAPPGFAFPSGAEIWSPIVLAPEAWARRDRHHLGAFGRLRPGVSVESAGARLALGAAERGARFPETDKERTILARTIAAGLRDAGAVPIFLLWQAAGLFVLLIGWLNVANLVLARGQERRRELALLDAMGAGRGRLVRLQLTEGLIFGFAAALLALPVAALGQKWMHDGIPVALRRFLPGSEEIGLDLTAVTFTFGLAIVSVAAVSLWPALRASGGSGGVASILREGGRSGSAGSRHQRGRSALVVAEIAVALVLAVTAGLTLHAAQRLLEGPQGYDPDGLVTFKLALPEERYAEPSSRRDFLRGALARLAEIPGVVSVAAANVLPATGSNSWRGIALAGEPEPDPNRAPEADLRTVAGDYFGTLRLPILSGRAFAPRDDENAPTVAVVSRSMAEKFWPGRDPIGQRFRAVGKDEPWLTVVGIAGDHLHHWFTRRDFPTYFVPAAQQPRFGATFALRTARAPSELGREIRGAIASVDSAQPIFELWSQRDQIMENTVGPRLVAGVMSTFAFLALILAVSGVYGVMAYRVSLQAREMGVRVALGATARDVLGSTLGRALRLAACGILIGVAASVGVGRLIGSVLRGAAGFELPVALVASALLALAALGAALVPARRLLALHPADVLRSE